MMFVITVWWIWRWRNDAAFNNRLVQDKIKVNRLREQYGEIMRAHTSDARMREDTRETLLKWRRPKVGTLALNVDVSVSSNHETSACGGVLRDCNGN